MRKKLERPKNDSIHQFFSQKDRKKHVVRRNRTKVFDEKQTNPVVKFFQFRPFGAPHKHILYLQRQVS